MASWQEARQTIEKTEQEAEKLLRQKSLYIKQKGEDYAYKGMNMLKEPDFARLPEPVKQYLFTCSRLEVQKTRLEALKNDISFINSPAKMAILRKKYKEEVTKQGINANTVESHWMLHFLQEVYARLNAEIQASKLEFLDKETKLEAWLKAGKPALETGSSLKTALANDEAEDFGLGEDEGSKLFLKSKAQDKSERISLETEDEEELDWDKERADEENAPEPIAPMYKKTLEIKERKRSETHTMGTTSSPKNKQ